ncbi:MULTISPECIES: hypothetical protein [Burkholderia]|uniref:hypothetical protein n=1 Tax=Burkholderia TaxID=32008 RepID=UPI0003989A81|nr:MULTISPECIES: hypothetical protein [Burkholderia]ERJ39086.1 hypothetical protein L810_6323 [Burkholderia sp. AU4i]KVU58827.1 hypothetical protein WK70_13145 [Burkholderia cepacia]MCA8194481.1 hypothetical protein [Burkholderia vietnamiensis]MCR5892169.1 hypothetical protein [Burkholderia sp. HAN2018]UEC01338.1 hypothetical protein LK462_22565 [Burkholderia vietnamiensis]
MKYQYSGPTSGVTLQDGENVQEVMLHTGAEVELPEGNEYTATLLAMGYLTPAAAPSTKPARPSVPEDQQKAAANAVAVKGV